MIHLADAGMVPTKLG